MEAVTLWRLARFVDNCDGILDTLESLVNVDSGTSYKAGVDTVGTIIAEHAQALGFAVQMIRQHEYGDHLLCRKPGSSHRLLFLAHMDTVFEAGISRERPFTVRGNRAYGPGVLDAKGGIVCLLLALKALRAVYPRIYEAADMTLIFNSDEEVLSPTSRPVIETEARQAEAVCVLEPARPGGEYVTSRKGIAKFWLEVQGKSAHAGMQPELGASAIHDIAYKIVEILALNDMLSGRMINIGLVRGGVHSNVVADKAEAEIDLRVWTLEDAEDTIVAMNCIIGREHVPGTRATFRGGLLFPPMARTTATNRLFARVKEAGRKLGLNLTETSTGGGSDGNIAALFAPVVDGMGPVGSGAHSPDEFIELSSLPERAKVLAVFISDWVDQPCSPREVQGLP